MENSLETYSKMNSVDEKEVYQDIFTKLFEKDVRLFHTSIKTSITHESKNVPHVSNCNDIVNTTTV